MKPKKSKKQRPNVHLTFDFSDATCAALSDALLFLLTLDDFSFENENISEDSASVAQDKLFSNETELSRGEVRATAKAIEVVLLRFPGNAKMYEYMEDDYPELLLSLEKHIPILQQIQPALQDAVQYLRKMK